jgi:hypothetical protein
LSRAKQSSKKHGQRDLAQSPANEKFQEEQGICVHKEIKLCNESSETPVTNRCKPKGQEIVNAINEPIVVHFHAINLHVFNKL